MASKPGNGLYFDEGWGQTEPPIFPRQTEPPVFPRQTEPPIFPRQTEPPIFS